MPLIKFGKRIALFIHIPKTGGSSIESSVRQMKGSVALLSSAPLGYAKCTPQHMHAELLERFIGTNFYDFSFAVVRHPITRIRSEFQMRCSGPNNQKDFEAWFNDTLDTYMKNPYVCDNHIRPQSDFLLPKTDVFHFEAGIKPVVDYMATRFDRKPPEFVPHKRKSHGQDKPLKMSNTTFERLTSFYQADFEKLGYPNHSDMVIIT